jgi:hypothetical protein
MQTIQGKIIKFLPKTEGDSASGKHWVKAGIVIEYGDEYPTKAAFSIFGEQRLQACAGLKEGMDVTVNYNPQSREYNERWYTDLQCISVTPITQQPAQQQANPTSQWPQENIQSSSPSLSPQIEKEDLPF